MKSRIVREAGYITSKEKAKYGELRVLHSAAGYYIGTLYTGNDGFVEPGSRDSDYFPSLEAAELALRELYTVGYDGVYFMRDNL